MELFCECFDTAERDEMKVWLEQYAIPVTLKERADESGITIHEIWIESKWMEKARNLMDESDAHSQAEEMQENPDCPKCYKQKVLLATKEVKNGAVLNIYQCEACKYEWLKK